ncbi:metallophosphoesterase [Pseudorhodoplanes sp.]|uniref:metallophosphoesterase family protein n=1 Tax=Pseudorhodoplanes sp. TaxID=1934341 RepID=UPI002C5B52C3|nr:metallophosphoesterase [Pseudorhodoplanes sp.]HWV55364.1 metallophosphoesterase [Pseudorhodoplanes sp.]
MGSFVLAHLSDAHLAPLPQPGWLDLASKRITGYLNWQRKRRFIHDPAVLEAIVADLRAAEPDHVAMTGDVINLGLREEFVRGRAWLNMLGSPDRVSLVPGNHDIYVPEAARMLPAWRHFMDSDEPGFALPYVRRRGPLAIIGVTSGVPTAPFLATGWIGGEQLARLRHHLIEQKQRGAFRVVLIHHPPVSDAGNSKRLLDASVFLRVIAEAGAELVLHGHDHIHSLVRLKGPDGTVPAMGVPSASAAPGGTWMPAAYNLYRIGGAPGAWTCHAISRGIGADGAVDEIGRIDVLAE